MMLFFSVVIIFFSTSLFLMLSTFSDVSKDSFTLKLKSMLNFNTGLVGSLALPW